MTGSRNRAGLVPNANNPRLLIRLVGLVAAGLRRPRAIADVLEIELRTVHYYTQAAEWLGLLEPAEDLQLTPRGVDLAFADPRQRMRRYSAAVWRQPLARRLLEGRQELPDVDAVTAIITEVSPELAPSTARRRASAVRSLVEPALRHKPGARTPVGDQLSLPFAPRARSAPVTDSPPDLRAGAEESPDVYARLLLSLLDHGELGTGHLRALLDRLGGEDLPLPGYVEMALRRGDARRIGDRLVATPGAVQRRAIAASGALVALSDPDYRTWLGLQESADAPHDASEARSRAHLGRRFAAWDQRLFGGAIARSAVHGAVEALLHGRSLRSLPVAGEPGPELVVQDRPFAEQLELTGIGLCLPRALSEVAGGVGALNGVLRRVREAPAAARPPSIAERRVAWHGGCVYPGEALPRAVPDNLSLRLRLLTHTPAIALYAALLLLDRRPDLPLTVEDAGHGPHVRWQRDSLGDLLPVLVGFAEARGWVVARPPDSGLDSRTLEAVARTLGIGTRSGRRLVLEEKLFVQLQEDPEAGLVYEVLRPLSDHLQAWLEGLTEPAVLSKS